MKTLKTAKPATFGNPLLDLTKEKMKGMSDLDISTYMFFAKRGLENGLEACKDQELNGIVLGWGSEILSDRNTSYGEVTNSVTFLK